MNNFSKIDEICAEAKAASYALSVMSCGEKNAVLKIMAEAVRKNAAKILEENRKDIDACKKPAHYIDRLRLTESRIEGMAKGVESVMALPDPVGRILENYTVPSGLKITKASVPLGVVGIIYEARPNVTIDTAALCIKSGNAIVLRGSSDAVKSNLCIVNIVKDALKKQGVNSDFMQIIGDTSRESAQYFMTLNRYIDVLIPRGSAGLIAETVKTATIPVIETGTGNCHVYVHCDADVGMARKIIVNAKISRPSLCNACESILIDRSAAPESLPLIAGDLIKENVTLKCCPESLKILQNSRCGERSGAASSAKILPAAEQDFYEEFLDYILSVKVVGNVAEAVNHINKYGTRHSDAIVTRNAEAAEYFKKNVDSAAVYVNASTRFTDGDVFGFGAELGISTQKLHARGPVGLRELTSYKYIVEGTGQIRE